MRFSGAQRLAVAGQRQDHRGRRAESDWNDPSFDGGFLPTERDRRRRAASRRDLEACPSSPAACPRRDGYELLSGLGGTAMGVSFVQPANAYQSVERALKYAPMFIGLVFLAYFLFETMSGRRMHAAQYVLVGLAQTIFYLLLLVDRRADRLRRRPSRSRPPPRSALISAYAGWVFESRTPGPDRARRLLHPLRPDLRPAAAGGLGPAGRRQASFAAIAAVMYFTRRIDWYGVGAQVRGGGTAERA